MKTNQLMTVAFKQGDIQGFHKTGHVSLTDLFSVGNKHRAMDGKTAANITHFLNSKATIEFIGIVAENTGLSADSLIAKKGRGKSARTFCNLHVAIYAAEYLSPQFHFEVIDKFIDGKIFSNRDKSGDEFIMLNSFIDDYLPKRAGMSNKGCYINLAKIIKSKVNPDGGSWNTANSEQLSNRVEVEKQLSTMLQLGVVRDWNHLKDLANKI